MGSTDSAVGRADGVKAQQANVEPPTSEEAERSVPGERKGKRHRRVTTAPVPGSDPTPEPEPTRHGAHENDDRLKADRPPHWRAGA